MEVHGHFKSNKLFEHAYKSFLYKTDVEIKGKKKRQASDLEQLVAYQKQA